MSSESLQKLAAMLHRDLVFLLQNHNVHQSGALAQLMYDAYMLGKASSTAPKLLSDATLKRLMDEVADLLRARAVDVGYYQMTALRRFDGNWESNEWEQLCIVRSGLQFFLDMFRNTVLVEEVESVDTSDIDAFIRERGDEGSLTDAEIPPEIPVSHWWWWFPGKPRARHASPA